LRAAEAYASNLDLIGTCAARLQQQRRLLSTAELADLDASRTEFESGSATADAKAREYATRLARYSAPMPCDAEKIEKLVDTLAKRKSALADIKAELAVFADLPPDLSLAKLRLEQSRQKLVSTTRAIKKIAIASNA
jgi:hypothetical protein